MSRTGESSPSEVGRGFRRSQPLNSIIQRGPWPLDTPLRGGSLTRKKKDVEKRKESKDMNKDKRLSVGVYWAAMGVAV